MARAHARASRSASLATALALVAALAGGCAGSCGDEGADPREQPPSPARSAFVWDAAERAEAIAHGRETLVRLECNRCHAIDDIEPASRPRHCTSCHVFLDGLEPGSRHHTTLSERYGADVIARYQRNIEHYLEVPDLTRAGARLRPAWIGEYVRDPYDLRPMMEETMVHVRTTEEDRRAIVRYFAAVAEVADPTAPGVTEPPLPPRPSRERIDEGERLFLARGCTTCHTFGNLRTGKSVQDLVAAGVPAKLAPNLRFTRERLAPDTIVAWILDPSSFVPGTRMPNLGLSRAEAEAIRDFLLFGDPELRPAPAPPPLELPPAAARPVPWEEVKERVLGRVCVHCHMNDHERDPGPGNEGGFGWPGDGVSMRTYEMLVRGARDGEGHRFSILEPRGEGGVPFVLEVMMRRRLEALRDHVPPFGDYERPPRGDAPAPGMPMGLPPMTDEEVGLLRAWIEQGCHGPDAITGMPGITDGYLVPDGPVTPGSGCEQRDPSPERPAWSTQPPPAWMREDGSAERAPASTLPPTAPPAPTPRSTERP